MTDQDGPEFFRRLLGLAELYDASLSETKAALYFEALRDLPFEQVAGALNAAVRTQKFFPRPAELRELVLGSSEDRAEAAWLALRAAMGRVGAYCSLATTDPALGEAITALFGSWPEACSCELSPEMWASKRKEFGRVYAVMAQRALTGARYLPGITEATNSGRLEWSKYFDVGVLEPGGEIRRLRGDAAERYRAAISAAAGMERLTAAGIGRLISAPKDAP